MKRLWKSIPPCLSDVMGFQAIVNETDGFGIVDDSSPYKPLPLGGGNPMMGGRGGRPGGFEGGRPEGGFGGGRPEGGFRGGRPDKSHGDGGDYSKNVGGWIRNTGMRVVQSDLTNEDIISGSEKKVLSIYEASAKVLDPSFVMLANAPGSSMISSDLETAADKIKAMSSRPAEAVKVCGDRDYVYGAAVTLEMLGKMILEKQETIPGTVNILGCNVIDWTEENKNAFMTLLQERGLKVLNCWGAKGMTAHVLKESTAASLNIAVTLSGIRLAQYMKEEFGIPFIAGSPFGNANVDEMFYMIEQAMANNYPQPWDTALGKEDEFSDVSDGGAEVLVIGEQFTANAIRRSLRASGYDKIRVLSFYEMNKAYMEPGDKKLQSEDDLHEFASESSVSMIIANPDYKIAAGREDVKWIGLPNSGLAIVNRVEPVQMVGSALDQWLAHEINA